MWSSRWRCRGQLAGRQRRRLVSCGLNPAAVVVPLEPPHLQITLISPRMAVGDLLPVGLTNRPELASQRALVAASGERVRQERFRPWLPTVTLGGTGPNNFYNGGVFGGGPDSGSHAYDGRFDAEVSVVWTLQTSARLVLVRRAGRCTSRAASIAFANVQDEVAQEVVQSHAAPGGRSAGPTGHDRGERSSGYLQWHTDRHRSAPFARYKPVIIMVNRPQEAVAALVQLNRAYGLYFTAVSDYNRSQFQPIGPWAIPPGSSCATVPSAHSPRWTPPGRPAWPPSANNASRPCP